MKRLKALIVLILSIQCASAQFFSHNLSIDNVMNSHQVRCVIQDKSGFLWMGSTNGLFRYDGYHYQRIQEKGHPDLLPDESVLSISNWGERYLWIRLRGDLYSCYDLDNGCFVDWNGNMSHQESYKRFVISDSKNIWLYDDRKGCRHVMVNDNGTFCSQVYHTANSTLPSDHVNFVIQERNGRAWVGTDHGLVNIRQGKSRVTVKDLPMTCAQEMANGDICFISEQGHVYQTHKSGSLNIFTPKTFLPSKVRRVAREKEQLILGTDGATYCYDTRRHTLEPHPYIHIDNAQVVSDNRGNKVVFDREGTNLWYLTPEKTYQLTDIYNKALTIQNGGGRFKFIFGSFGRIWITTYGNGLFAYNTQTGLMDHYSVNDKSTNLLASDFLQDIYEDHSGHLWICQENLGVRLIGEVRQHQDVRYFTTEQDYGHANTIRLIQPAGDHILIGNRQNALWTTDEQLNILHKDNPYGDDVVAASTDTQGRLWIGTRNRGVFVDGSPLTPAIKGKVSDIICDRKGRIWISVFDGAVYLVTGEAPNGMNVRTFFKGQHAVSQPRSMLEDHQGRLWLCSNKGVYLFHPDELIKNDSAYQHINVAGNNSNSDEVHCLFEDSKHRIWAGTTGYGLVLIDNTGHVIKRYTDKNGLPNNGIESIIEDLHGDLWTGTSYGLAKYQPEEDRFNAFFLSNNPLGLMYTEGCATLLRDGRIAMGTLYGMQVFNPRDIRVRASIFPLAITDIRVNGVSLQNSGDDLDFHTTSSGLKELHLSHDQNSLTFYFSDFEYVNSQLVKYSYRLEGFDKQWSEPSGQNFTTYKNLRPGKYTLHVRSYNIYGMQNEHEVTLPIVVRHPWWNTWWAWCIYLLVAGALAWSIWKYLKRMDELRTRIKVENQLTEYKLRFYTNISHEFRTPLTIIRGAMDRINALGDVPGNLKQPISSMQKSTSRMLRLVNELLEFRKIQNQQLRLSLEETDIIGFLRNIFLTFNETAENRRINYQFSTPVREYKMFIDRNYVDKMAYNLLSNAFKYTTQKNSVTLRIKLDEDNRQLLFEVEDTGIGVPKEKQADLFTRFNQSTFSRESIGIGLHMVQELVRVHHGHIAFRENPEGGSIFSITLPTDQSVYQPDDFLTANDLLREQDESATASSPAITYKEMERPPLNDHTILVVEDDDDMRDHLAVELRPCFVVETACNGEDALQKIRQQRPAVVISDIRMPIMNGFKLIQKIRQDKELSDLPVILLTGISDEEKMVKGTEYGADAYLFKPFNTKILIAKCSALIEQRERLRVKYAKEVVGSAPIADVITENTDKKFLDRFDSWIYGNLKNPNLQLMDFANSMKMGRTTFFKKVKQLTGMPPHEYIKKIRLTHAAELLGDPVYSIAEVAYETGFDDPNYFSRIFKDYYGMTASQFRKGHGNKTPKGDTTVSDS